jgi:hypothetical protein
MPSVVPSMPLAIVEGGDVGVESLGEQLPVARFVAHQDFGFEEGIALNANEKRRRRGDNAGELQVLVEPARRANRARRSGPQRGMRTGFQSSRALG